MKIPVFILSAGPRCGTTWLARSLTATNEILIWGEPNFFRAYTEYSDLVKHTYEDDTKSKTNLYYFREHKADMWMAHLRPFEGDLKNNFFEMMQKMLDNSTFKEGFPRWGVKEIIWSMHHVQLIRENFDDYRIIFLTRNFLDYYRSVVGSWVSNEFGRHNYIAEWIEQTTIIAYLQMTARERMFKYEDLRASLKSLANFCQVSEPPEVSHIGGSSKNITKKDWDIALPYLPIINALHEQCGYAPVPATMPADIIEAQPSPEPQTPPIHVVSNSEKKKVPMTSLDVVKKNFLKVKYGNR